LEVERNGRQLIVRLRPGFQGFPWKKKQSKLLQYYSPKETSMAIEHENLAARHLVVTELDQPFEVTEEDATLVAIACTCTCDVPFVQSASAQGEDGGGVETVGE
jgi:hypothetical protein